jgi:hypothetical protein
MKYYVANTLTPEICIVQSRKDVNFLLEANEEGEQPLFLEITEEEAYLRTDGAIEDETTYFDDDVDPDMKVCWGWDWPSEEAFAKSCEKDGIFCEDF